MSMPGRFGGAMGAGGQAPQPQFGVDPRSQPHLQQAPQYPQAQQHPQAQPYPQAQQHSQPPHAQHAAQGQQHSQPPHAQHAVQGQRSHAGAPASGPASAPSAHVGQLIDDRYVIEGILGEGGMGMVYKARHHKIDRRVALKVLKKEWAGDKEIVDRFVLEAKACSAIGNPHIIDILDFGTLPDGSTYFAMEFLDGISLTTAINQKLDPERIASIAIQCCDGLGAAHARGIVHRDLKPDNIFLLSRNGGDFVKLLDFGIAKVSTDSTQKLTRAGAVFGTPHYMSPEQAAGTAVDHRADIYALGVILYEMASGQLPFDSDNFMGILTQHMYKAPVPIRALVNNSSCPPGLEAIVQKCLEKRPSHRYQSTAELADDLRRFLDKQVPKAVSELMGRSNQYSVPVDYFRTPGTGPIVPASPPTKSRGVLLGVVIATLILAAAGLFAFIKFGPSGKAAASTTSAPSAAPSEPAAPSTAAAESTTGAPASASAATPGASVEISSPVASAVLVDGDKERPLPASVEVAQGKKLTLVVRAPGHEDTPVTVDGSKPKVEVSPKKVASANGAPKPPSTGGAATSSGPAKPPPTTTAKPNDGWDGPVKIFK